MARNNSFIKLEGSLDGLTFYKSHGQSLVKTTNKISRARIMNDPAFKRTRENMQEFGGAAVAGKAFRDAFAGMIQQTADTYMSGRVGGLMKRIINQGDGLRGERDLDIVDHGVLFRNFEFHKVSTFDSRFFAPSELPSINATRDVVSWDIPDFNTDTYIKAPEGATHCRLVLASGYVSNYGYVTAVKGYEPVEDTVNGRGGFAYSADIALGAMVGSATALSVDMSALGTIPATAAVFAGVGIVFFQEVNGDLYELAQGSAFKIAVAG